jgi:hypothetical protein
MSDKIVFTVGDVELAVNRPEQSQIREAQRVFNKAVNEALADGAILREALDIHMRKQGLWGDSQQAEFNSLTEDINRLEGVLARGGLKKTPAKKICLELKEVRAKLNTLLAVRMSLNNLTVQGQAENTRFNYLVSVCTVYNKDGKSYFSSLDDYLSKADSEAGKKAAENLANMMYGLENDYDAKLPENRVLTKLKLVDKDLRLINENGHLIDSDGRLINENNRYVNEQNQLVDIHGNLVDEKGNLIVEEQPFLDDDGNPIT